MRILHLTDHYPPVVGGIETHVAGLALRQALGGDEVTVLTSTPATAEGHRPAGAGPVEVLRARSVLDGARVGLGGFDLVHAHVSVVAPFTAPLVASFSRRGMPVVVTVHSLWNGMGPVPRLAASVSGLRSAPVTWTAVSAVAAAEVRRRLPRGTPVHVVPNAVEVPPRRRTPVHDEVRLVSTMRIAHRKRPLPLLRIFEEVTRSATVPVTLTVVGDGPLRARFERRAHRLGLDDRVRAVGEVAPAQVLEELAGSDVYVAPAVLESFGLAALEARAVGLPVVGRRGTGLVDFIDHGVEGLLCADDLEMTHALDVLVHDAALRHRMSEHSRTVAHDLSWARSLARHERLYALARRDRVGEVSAP
jgi:glycosyltransferase involved in cell wall biosynthesis